MDLVQKNLLEQVAGLHEVPEGAYNIRANGKKAARNTTANIDIVTKEDKDGIDIIIKPGTVNESVHIPVVLRADCRNVYTMIFTLGRAQMSRSLRDAESTTVAWTLPSMRGSTHFIWRKMQK